MEVVEQLVKAQQSDVVRLNGKLHFGERLGLSHHVDLDLFQLLLARDFVHFDLAYTREQSPVWALRVLDKPKLPNFLHSIAKRAVTPDLGLRQQVFERAKREANFHRNLHYSKVIPQADQFAVYMDAAVGDLVLRSTQVDVCRGKQIRMNDVIAKKWADRWQETMQLVYSGSFDFRNRFAARVLSLRIDAAFEQFNGCNGIDCGFSAELFV